MNARLVYLLFTLLFAIPATAEVIVDEGYIRLPPPNARSAAGYGTLVNRGDANVEVTDVRSDRFQMSMLHATVIEDGVSKMRHMNNISISPGRGFEFKPNGPHMMLMRPKSPLQEGEMITVELLVNGAWQAVELPVIKR